MRLNTANRFDQKTREGAPAARMTPEQALRRSVMSAFLWEDGFYEDGVQIADRVTDLARNVSPETLAAIAIEAVEVANLRHMPLLLVSALAETGAGRAGLVSDAIERVIRRPDQMGELLAIHAHRNGVTADKVKGKMSAQMKKGLARAFGKFDAYQLAKWDRDAAIRLRDVLFLCHAKPGSNMQAITWGKLIDGTLETPDTWEVALSGGADKRDSFTRLLRDGKMGYLALLRNLRGMLDAGVDETLIRDAILARKGADKVLPFRFTAAARACPRMEAALDEALCERVLEMPLFSGRTIVLADVSGSMKAALSKKSDMTRMDACATLASVIHGDVRVATFSDRIVEVPARRGMAGVDVIIRSQHHNGTDLREAVLWANAQPHDRLIVITDEQSRYPVPDPVCAKAYMINVASDKNGVGYGKWTHIDGFSENVLRFIHEAERDIG